MAALQGTILASKIVPTDSLDTYATHEDKYGRGGHRSVDTLEERDNITTPRRKEGMTVYVKENKTKYVLEGGIDNANWKVDSSGGDVDLSDYYNKTETYNKAEVDTKIAEIPSADLTNYYNKTEVDNKIADIPETDLSNYYNKTETYSKVETDSLLDTKQDVLVSGTSIKTINGQSVLGSGGINLEGLSELPSPKVGVEVLTPYRCPVNGKPFYSKIIDCGFIPALANHYWEKDIGISNPETTIDFITPDYPNSFVHVPNYGAFSFGMPQTWHAVGHNISFYVDNYKIAIGTANATNNNKKLYCAIKYTKTSDTAESPVRLVGGGSGGEVDLTDYYTKSETDSLVDTKQDTLVSGTSIKTINGQSVLGNGNIFITAEADLSNYYTKPQVDGFINEINAELGSMVVLGEYGLRWNQETDVYEALGATNRTQIQRNMKRCVLKDDGTVNYYLHSTNSTLKEDNTAAVLTGADGNVMVEVPKFWYKHTLVGDTHEWWVSNTPLAGYSVHPWFLEGGVERPFRYYRAYTPTVVAGKLRSISGSTPTRSQTRSTFRTQARANGTGWELCSWNAVNAIQLLFLTEYCTFNTQAVLGTGNDTGSDLGITTGQSNSIGNASSGATNNNMWMSYRGIENWYADCWEMIDGINVQNYKVFLNQNPATFADDVFTGDYIDSGVTLPAMNNNYIKKITGNFFPTAVGGSSSTFVTDAGISLSGNRFVSFGGAVNGLLNCGGFSIAAGPLAETAADWNATGLSR